MIKDNVSKMNVSNTVMILTWWNRSNAHSNGKVNFNIFNKNILCAIGKHLSFITWFWNNGIIKVGDLESSIGSISSSVIDSISVQWEHWELNIETLDINNFFLHDMRKESAKFKLSPDVNINLKVMEIAIFNLVWYDVERRRVGDEETHDLNVSSCVNLNKFWSMG
jgi:hypothetical protein